MLELADSKIFAKILCKYLSKLATTQPEIFGGV